MAESPDRLTQLRRQRALIADHLAWLDRQIETAGDDLPPSAQPPVKPQPGTAATPVPNGPALTTPPAALIEDWMESRDPSERPLSKTGCWVVFATLMLLTCGAALWAVYHFWG